MKMSNKIMKTFYILLAILQLFLVTIDSMAKNAKIPERPLAVDSRIRTLIFNENEIFRIVMHSGFQTIIEFAQGEEIDLISSGNEYAWKIKAIGRRLFINPLENNILTNMTIITNQGRVYNLELQSKPLSNIVDEELAYIVRFFYPEREGAYNKGIENTGDDEMEADHIKNQNYTLVGPDELSPTEVFDDGKSTYFRFKYRVPKIAISATEAPGGKMILIPSRNENQYIIVDKIAAEFRLSLSGGMINIYNENYNFSSR